MSPNRTLKYTNVQRLNSEDEFSKSIGTENLVMDKFCGAVNTVQELTFCDQIEKMNIDKLLALSQVDDVTTQVNNEYQDKKLDLTKNYELAKTSSNTKLTDNTSTSGTKCGNDPSSQKVHITVENNDIKHCSSLHQKFQPRTQSYDKNLRDCEYCS
ncbi:unnamed protein product [Heterobilharzia americana]|nr:unnamed protein product [Heterobilharzia americana]